VRRFAALVLSASLVGGCGTTVHTVSAFTPETERAIRDDHPRAELEVLALGPDGSARQSTLVRLLPTEAIVSTSKGERQVPLASVKEVSVMNRARGAVGRLHQPDTDPQAVAGAADAALEDVARRGGPPPRHRQVWKARESGDHVLADPCGERA